jgi:hypothetical protein
MVDVDGEVASKPPKAKRDRTFAYPTADGRLVRENPDQKEMAFEG